MRKANKKQCIGWVQSYLRSDAKELWQVYGSFSNAKARSYEAIKSRMFHDGGRDLRILSHNCNVYVCGYQLGDDLVVDTRDNTYVVENWKGLL